jgi:hypothetical protein
MAINVMGTVLPNDNPPISLQPSPNPAVVQFNRTHDKVLKYAQIIAHQLRPVKSTAPSLPSGFQS